MQISLSTIMNDFKKYDINGDGQLDRPEIANAALNLLSNPSTGNEGELFATFVEGGVNGQGLLPDENGDGKLSLQELQDFAAKGPDPSQLSTATFQAAFGSQATQGQDINIDELQTLASQNSDKFNIDPNNPTALYSTNWLANNTGDANNSNPPQDWNSILQWCFQQLQGLTGQ